MKKKILKPKETPKPAEKKAAPVKVVRKLVKKDKPAEKEFIPVASLSDLHAPRASHKPRKIKGRGPSSGHGKTSTRGSKGQTSRAGRHFYLGYEGGQTPLIRRIPKRGFTSRSKKQYQIVNLDDLNRFKEPNITLELLEEKGLIKHKEKLVKVLGDGKVQGALTVQAHAFSKKAAQEIVSAGGKAEVVNV